MDLFISILHKKVVIRMSIGLIKEKNNLNILDSIKDEITYGGYLAALGSPCLVISTCLIINIKLDLPMLLISYLLPLIVYSYDYYKDIDKDIKNDSIRAIYLKKKAKNYPFIFSFYIILLAFLLVLYSNYSLIAFILAIILSGLLYNFLLKDFTKKIPAFKNMFTAIIWALGGAFFPLFYNSLCISESFLIMFILIFSRCIINVIFFDLKDIENDKAEGLKTLPVIIGKNNTIKILNFVNIIAFIPLILGIYFYIVHFKALFLVIFFFYGYYYINKGNLHSSSELEAAAHKLADSEFILWPLLLLAVNIII